MIHRVMVLAVVLYIIVAEKLARPATHFPLNMVIGFGIVAAVIAAIAFSFRTKMLPMAVAALRRDPQDTQALFRWRKTHILIMVPLVSVALFGFALRFMGASFWIAFPFYFVSLALLVLWSPGEVTAANGGLASR